MLGLGGLGDMSKLLGGVRELQQKSAEVQERLARQTVVGESGGGMVKATVNGKSELLAVEIEPDLMNGDDREMVQELIVAAVRQANDKARDLKQAEMDQLLGDMNIPPSMLGMLGMNPGG